MPEHQQIQQSKKPDTIFQKQSTPASQTPVSNPYSSIQRAKINPKSLTHADIMQLQRTIGNRAVGMLLTGIGNTSTAQQAPVQRQEIPEEEETCPSCMQRQEIPEEEEPLQGKMIQTIQRQEIPEEEEPLQGKFTSTDSSVQRQEIPEEEELLQGKFENKPEIACPSCFAAPTMQRQGIPEEEEPLQGKIIETIQRQEFPEEEEPLQGKFETIQRQEIPKEEEPLQGKMAETVQRQEIPEEEEPLQGKFEGIQRQEIPEEEEPLQGKIIETIQRQEFPEEEEPLQGKFETIQRQEIPEEEEPLQGKMAETVQRQEIPEEEEPLQGKMIGTIQRQEITEEEEPLQGKFESIQRKDISEEEEPLQTKRENNTGMPDNLKAGVENLSGIDMSDVRVHYNSSKPSEVGALAYTQGTDIHVAPGQERHLPHEAWHVVQQKQERVQATTQMKGLGINNDPSLEHEADMMGAKTAQLNTLAYTQGTDIHVDPEQEKHLSHEAWHVVQHEVRGVAPTVQCALDDDNTGRAIATPTVVSEWGTMKRHHVIGRAKLRGFADRLVTAGKEGLMSSWMKVAVRTHFKVGTIGRKTDRTKLKRLALANGITAKSVIDNGFNVQDPLKFAELSSALQWTPGNIVPGPAKRTDDPHVMEDLDEPLLKITGNPSAYRIVDKMVSNPNILDPSNKDELRNGLNTLKELYESGEQRVPDVNKWEKSETRSDGWYWKVKK